MELRNSGFRDHDAGIVHAKIVVAGDHAGKAVHQHAMAGGGGDIEDNPPALPGPVAGPVVVGDDDAVVFRVSAGGDERAAIARRRGHRRIRAMLTRVQLRNVIVGHFFEGVQGHDVPNIGKLRPDRGERRRRGHSRGDGGKLLLVFGVNVRPQNVLSHTAEKFPIALGAIGAVQAHGGHRVYDFPGQQEAVLEADLFRGTFQMDVDPAAVFKVIAAFQAWIHCTGSGLGLVCSWQRHSAQEHAGCQQQRDSENQQPVLPVHLILRKSQGRRISTTDSPLPISTTLARLMKSPCSTTPGVSLSARASAGGSGICPKLQSRI